MLTGKELLLKSEFGMLRKPSYLAKLVAFNAKEEPLAQIVVDDLIFCAFGLPLVWYTNSHIVGFLFFVVHFGVFFGPYMCFIHRYSHTRVFKSRLFSEVLAHFFLHTTHGLPYATYWVNHLIAHHKGGNAWDLDPSSTEHYNRESFIHFLYYYVRRYTPLTFCFDMIYSCLRHKRYKICVAFVLGASFLYGLAVCLALWCPIRFWAGVSWTIIAPLIIVGPAGAYGSWMQHMFVHPIKPRKWYSFDIVNSTAIVHEGYHNVHHTYPHLHWTDLHNGFVELLPQYAEDNVLILHTIDNILALYYVFTRQWKKLATFVATARKGGHSEEDCIKHIRMHLAPVYFHDNKNA